MKGQGQKYGVLAQITINKLQFFSIEIQRQIS